MFAEFIPINDNILVQIRPEETTTATGIYIPTEARDKNQEAVIIHAGKSTQLKSGDVIYYKKYMGVALDETYLVLKEEEILGIM